MALIIFLRQDYLDSAKRQNSGQLEKKVLHLLRWRTFEVHERDLLKVLLDALKSYGLILAIPMPLFVQSHQFLI